MKKAIVISCITLFALTCAFIYANSSKPNEAPAIVMTSDSTEVKPCPHKTDSTACAHQEHKCKNHEEGKPCCKKK